MMAVLWELLELPLTLPACVCKQAASAVNKGLGAEPLPHTEQHYYLIRRQQNLNQTAIYNTDTDKQIEFEI